MFSALPGDSAKLWPTLQHLPVMVVVIDYILGSRVPKLLYMQGLYLFVPSVAICSKIFLNPGKKKTVQACHYYSSGRSRITQLFSSMCWKYVSKQCMHIPYMYIYIYIYIYGFLYHLISCLYMHIYIYIHIHMHIWAYSQLAHARSIKEPDQEILDSEQPLQMTSQWIVSEWDYINIE